jgi:hypothetical protein
MNNTTDGPQAFTFKTEEEILATLVPEDKVHWLAMLDPNADHWLSDRMLAFLVPLLHDGVAWARIEQRAKEAHIDRGTLRRAAEAFRDRDRGMDPAPLLGDWPQCHPAAYYGILGEIVRAIEPETEADPVGLLGTLLAMAGNALGRHAHGRVGITNHYPNIFVCILGDTSHGRKGTGADICKHLMGTGEGTSLRWGTKNIKGGISTGEGIIWNVRDACIPAEGSKEKEDPGISDKRLCLVETEMARMLTKANDHNSIVSHILREAWDTGSLQSLTSGRQKSPVQATGAHISIVGHITGAELRELFAEKEAANGFGNRFLWLCVRRSKLLPQGGVYPEEALRPLLDRLWRNLARARTLTQVSRNAEANTIWDALYRQALSIERPGLLGSMAKRAEAYVFRLSVLYALCDGTSEITREHLSAAYALWLYSEDSILRAFGESLGDATGDSLLDYIREAGDTGRTRTELYAYMGNNARAKDINNAVRNLIADGYVEEVTGKPEGRGRPTKFTRAVNTWESKILKTRANASDADILDFLHLNRNPLNTDTHIQRPLNTVLKKKETSFIEERNKYPEDVYGTKKTKSYGQLFNYESPQINSLCGRINSQGAVCQGTVLRLAQGRQCIRCNALHEDEGTKNGATES